MASFWKYSIFILGAILFFSCKEKKTKIEDTITQTDTIHIEYVDSIYDLANAYTKIKTQLCDTIGFEDLTYTNANTEIFSLSPEDSTRKFLFITEVDCGFPGGNCGKTIEVIERINNKYQSLIKVCGKIDSIYLDQKKLEYSTISSRKYSIDFSTSKIATKIISIHDMPVDDLKSISKYLSIIEENLVLKGVKTDNLDAIPVTFEKINVMGKEVQAYYYQFEHQGFPYSFVFVHQRGKTKQQIGGKGVITIQNKQNLNIELLVKDEEEEIKVWKFNKNKRIFSTKI